MRNLTVGIDECNIDWAAVGGLEEEIDAFCVGASGDGRIYCATAADPAAARPPAVVCVAGAPGARAEWRVPLLPPGYGGAGGGADGGSGRARVVSLSYVLERDALLAALSSGELLLVDAGTREVEEVGAVAGGVAAAAWSPDGGALAVAGAEGGQLLLLSQVRVGSGGRAGRWLQRRDACLCQGSKTHAKA